MSIAISFRALPMILLGLIMTACGTTESVSGSTQNTTESTSGNTRFMPGGIQDQKVQAFASMNFDNLQQDMARGQGEYLVSLGALLGIPEERQAGFYAFTRDHYPALIQSDRTTPGEMITALSALRALSPNKISWQQTIPPNRIRLRGASD
jgi:hypothetical protein